jgi:hypothetical protein
MDKIKIIEKSQMNFHPEQLSDDDMNGLIGGYVHIML